MKSRILLVCLLALAFSAGAAVSTNSLVVTPPPVQIVTWREDVDLDAVIAEFKLEPKLIYRALHGFAAPMDAATIQQLQSDGRILYVEADGPVVQDFSGLNKFPRKKSPKQRVTKADVAVADESAESEPIISPPQSESLARQFGLNRMGILDFPVAQINEIQNDLDVDVAILDTGIDAHEDLVVFKSYSPFRIETDSDYSIDEIGHGTSVAGVVAARDNSIGTVGIAPGVRIWNIKAIGPPPNNAWANVLTCLDYVLQNSNKISVLNISLVNEGNVAPIGSLRLGLRRLVKAGVVVVAAAGNTAWDLAGPGENPTYGNGDDAAPASLVEAMAVSAMDPTPISIDGPPTDTLWSGSNYAKVGRTNTPPSANPPIVYPISSGGAIEISAPGVNIYTTLPKKPGQVTGNEYGLKTGTSFAAPFVTGLVALYIAANGRAYDENGVYRIRQAIIDNALPQSQWHTNNTLDPDTRPEPLAMASENWVPRPVLTNSGSPGSFQLGFTTVPGYDYTVQVTTNLTPPIVWANLSTITGSNFVALASITDTNIASQSFYRLARQSLVGRLHVIVPPQSRTNVVGTIASLSVTVSGDTPDYRWHKDGTPLADGGKISGAATSELTLTGVQSTDAGTYSVVITNLHGSVTSAPASLTIQSVVLVTGVLATATSELASHGRYASNAVNGVYVEAFPWQSVGVNFQILSDPSPAITFDLGTVRSVEKFQIWNAGLGPSIKRMLVETSNDGISFNPVGEFTLTTTAPASETVPIGRVTGRYVRFAVRENGDGQVFPVVGPPTAGTLGSFAAINEVEFYEYLSD